MERENLHQEHIYSSSKPLASWGSYLKLCQCYPALLPHPKYFYIYYFTEISLKVWWLTNFLLIIYSFYWTIMYYLLGIYHYYWKKLLNSLIIYHALIYCCYKWTNTRNKYKEIMVVFGHYASTAKTHRAHIFIIIMTLIFSFEVASYLWHIKTEIFLKKINFFIKTKKKWYKCLGILQNVYMHFCLL